MISSRGKPDWLKIRPPTTEKFSDIKEIMRRHGLHTVCEESHCPNISECWSGGTATFMVMGDTCTRGCRFCEVKSGPPLPLDPFEPDNLAHAIAEMGLDYVVVTSVDRDELPDQGSEHFAKCIRAIKASDPDVLVEVLIPDFRGDAECLKRVVEAGPDVIAHNVETVPSLQSTVRDRRANYRQSLSVLNNAKRMSSDMLTKSSMIVGFGETDREVIHTMKDLRAIDVDFFTIGQYLRPSDWHLPVAEYVAPERFEFLKTIGEDLGFRYVASGPFVRSSYRAGELFVKSLLRGSA